MQAIRNGQFAIGRAMYDLGSAGNWYRYGQEKPPLYPIEEITCKNIAFISSMNDWLSSPEDVDILRRRLTVELVDEYIVPMPKWNHFDFIIGRDAGRFVNKRIVQLLEKFA
jgi:hypothetical protein